MGQAGEVVRFWFEELLRVVCIRCLVWRKIRERGIGFGSGRGRDG